MKKIKNKPSFSWFRLSTNRRIQGLFRCHDRSLILQIFSINVDQTPKLTRCECFDQGYSANKKMWKRIQKNTILKQLQIHFKVKKVWEPGP